MCFKVDVLKDNPVRVLCVPCKADMPNIHALTVEKRCTQNVNVVICVVANDGDEKRKQMEFPMSDTIETNGSARKRTVRYGWDAEAGVLTQSINGEVAQSFHTAELSSEIMDMLAIHGLRQKLADSHAGKIPEAAELAKDVWDGLVAGNWSSRGEGAERIGLFVEAYAAIKQRPVDEIRRIVNAIEAGDDDDKKALLAKARANKDVVAKMRTLAAERAAARAEAAQRAATGEEAVDL